MFTLFLILAVLCALVVFPAILLQAGQGGGLSTQFGGTSASDAVVGGRRAATLLHRLAWWGGGLFLSFCFVLQLIGSRGSAPQSLVEQELRRQQQQQQAAPPPLIQSAPQVPLQETPGAAPATAPATQGQQKAQPTQPAPRPN